MSLDKLYQLCRHLLPEDPSFEKEVQELIENRFKQPPIAARFSINRDHPRFPWFALIHGLLKRELMFELQSHTNAHPFLYKQKYTTHHSPILQICENNNRIQHDADLFLTFSGREITKLGYVIAEFPQDHNLSHVTIIHQASAPSCVRLARESGYGRIIIHPARFYTEHPFQ